MRIDVLFDPTCPWCFIGKRRLEAVLRQRPRVTVATAWRPFLLNPGVPPEGMDRGAYVIHKFGGRAQAKRVYAAVAEAGRSVDIDFAFDHIKRTPNVVNAHRLVRFAARAGKAGEAVEALFRAYFLDGADIGRLAVLSRLGAGIGLDERSLGRYLASDEDSSLIAEESEAAHRSGINGVPAFIFNGKMVISGAHEPEILARVMDAAQTIEYAA